MRRRTQWAQTFSRFSFLASCWLTLLRSLNDIQSPTSALLSCRHIYSSFKQRPGIEAEIVRRHVTPALVPYAVASAEASRLPRPPEGTGPLFFRRHTPWENEQLGCVLDFLEAEPAKASFEVVAHHVDFGEFSIDYLTVLADGDENRYGQLWLSQGIDFLRRLSRETSWDEKKELPRLQFDTGNANLPEALCNVPQSRTDIDRVFLEADAEEKLRLVMPEHKYEEDVDQGPLRGVDRRLRQRAHVLWDRDRIEKQHVLQGPSEDSGSGYGDEEWEGSLESFDERSQTWRDGGAGHWSKSDTSRIV
ncbi:hypothetical protein LX36DRAFT_710352 [Colletotrichum falcatum]|nr:hypothetical protein LX36DRAFT_710352 [Colletotrichum falcatum]